MAHLDGVHARKEFVLPGFSLFSIDGNRERILLLPRIRHRRGKHDVPYIRNHDQVNFLVIGRDIYKRIKIIKAFPRNHQAVFTRLELDLARRTRALGNRLAVYRRDSALRSRLDFNNELLRARKRERAAGTEITKAARTRPGIATNLLEERCCLLLDNILKVNNGFAAARKTCNQLIARSLVQFRAYRKRIAKFRYTGLGHKVSRNVLACFGKAATLAILDGLTRWQHHVDVLAGHDSPVLLRRKDLYRLATQDIGQVLAFLQGKQVLVRNGFQDGDILCQGCYRQKEQRKENSEEFFHTLSHRKNV